MSSKVYKLFVSLLLFCVATIRVEAVGGGFIVTCSTNAACSIPEDQSPMAITVINDGTDPISISLATADGTAVAGTNYNSASTPETMLDVGEQLTISIDILQDGVVTGDLSFNVDIFDDSGNVLDRQVVTILNVDVTVPAAEIEVTDCNNTCSLYERCVVDDNSSIALTNLGELPRCVLTNECSANGCTLGKTCCGHTCECIWPRYRRQTNRAYCDECDCQFDQLCTINGSCICDDQHVRVTDSCIECNPSITCPNCALYGKRCTVSPGNPNGTCECPPGQVENKDGECVACIPCPKECPIGQVCLTNLITLEAYCGCPAGTRNKDGKCIPTPACPQCHADQVCVIHGAEAECECPQGTVWHWEQCMPIDVCPSCPEHEICVIPNNGDAPYCKCKEGYLRQDGVCLECSIKREQCYHNKDCYHGKVCTDGQCECPKNYTPKWGKCIRPGLAGGLCDDGKCYGKHVTCGSSGYCECSSYAYKDPQPVCIQKKKKKYW